MGGKVLQPARGTTRRSGTTSRRELPQAVPLRPEGTTAYSAGFEPCVGRGVRRPCKQLRVETRSYTRSSLRDEEWRQQDGETICSLGASARSSSSGLWKVDPSWMLLRSTVPVVPPSWGRAGPSRRRAVGGIPQAWPTIALGLALGAQEMGRRREPRRSPYPTNTPSRDRLESPVCRERVSPSS